VFDQFKALTVYWLVVKSKSSYISDWIWGLPYSKSGFPVTGRL